MIVQTANLGMSVRCGAALRARVLRALGVHLFFLVDGGDAECMLTEKSTSSFP